MTSNCVFCEIVAGQAVSSMVYRDDVAVSFMDIRPINSGHVLVVPTAHASSLSDLEEGAGAHLFRLAHRIARAIRNSAVQPEGMNLLLADGAAAGQEIMHIHLHVIPRYRGDGFGLRLGQGYGRQHSRSELEHTVESIRGALSLLEQPRS